VERPGPVSPALFGASLRAQREARKQTLQQVVEITKIATRHLQSLERGDIRHWPGGVYRRGMIRAYAEAIGLDAPETVRRFLEVFPEEPAGTPAIATDAAAQPDRHGTPIIRRAAPIVGIVGAATAALMLVGWYAVSYIRGAVNADRVSTPPPAPPETLATVETKPAPEPDPVSGNAGPLAGTSGTAREDSSDAVGEDVTSVTAPVEGELRVQSDPDGAQVTVNGIGWGRTPVTIKYLPMGEKRVRLSKDGYQSAERRIDITAERPIRPLRVTLQPR
jgi:cytoskeletal protein RodZ